MSLYKVAVETAGGEDRVCEDCKAITDSYNRGFSGVWDGPGERPNYPVFSTTLADATSKSRSCWHCGWIGLLTTSTWPDDVVGSTVSKVVTKWEAISNGSSHLDGRGRGPPSVERLVITYYATEDWAERKQLRFYMSQGRPPNLASIAAQIPPVAQATSSLDWTPTAQPYAGRVRPSAIDGRLLRRWKDCCMKDHGGTCDQTFMTRRVPQLRFVDVEEKCVVEAAPDTVTSWVALSYCWGGPQLHALQKKNLEAYRVPGALADRILPGESSMRWPSREPSASDDDKDKLEFIAAMGTIYAHAAVTIVNAANDKVALGIPGISLERRMQQVHQMKDFWWVESLDLCHEAWEGYLHGTAWNTRGWTFQEGLLSPRCLVITQDQVYWQCKTASWCEDSCWEAPPSSVLGGRGIYRHYSGSGIMGRLTDHAEEDWLTLYQDILKAYTKRELTSESDRLGAVQAILDVLGGRRDETGYFWGMPVGHMEMALNLVRDMSAHARRRGDAMFMGANNEVQTAPFPSWSWLGWHGSFRMPTLERTRVGGRLGLKFYRIVATGPATQKLEALVETPFAGPEKAFSQKDYLEFKDELNISYPRGLTHPFMDYSQQSIALTDVPPSVLAGAEAPSALCFWTSTAVLRMKHHGRNNFHRCPAISLSHGDVCFHGGKWEDDDAFRPDGDGEEGKFVVVGTERTRMSHGGHVTVNLLLVEQGEDGVSRRSRLVTYTPAKVWESFENRKWELVFLV
ncbi:HET-domain-containing protein [Apiospora rasikravindrae]|uniref:HET-domain-containing protein n=1 Tax=Apiospora rasikravindrae TaxID=990691 RepID=A0ABR1TBT0_9PEZI